MTVSHRRLKKTLDRLYQEYSDRFYASPETFFADRPDPIVFPRRYASFHDREAAGFLAATFAYGNVASLCGFIDRLLKMMEPSPHRFLMRGEDALVELAERKPYYRLHKTSEIMGVLFLLSEVYRTRGSLYEIFLSGYKYNSTTDIVLIEFVTQLRALAMRDLKFLVPSPDNGSPCKRLNLFLRWMVRRKDVDLGLWDEVSPARLIMPLDTHIGRIAYRLGWIRTPSLSWQKAADITAILRGFNPEDPLRYDFALCHESIQKSAWLKELTAMTPGK